MFYDIIIIFIVSLIDIVNIHVFLEASFIPEKSEKNRLESRTGHHQEKSPPAENPRR